MATPDGLFYAFAKCAIDDSTYRYIITFQNQSVADQWWRAVTNSVAAGYTRFNTVTRLSNQWYTHNPYVNNGNISQTIDDAQVAANFLGKVFFTLINDLGGRDISVAPVLNYPIPSSGSQFFIRSVLQPELFWYYDPGAGRIRASTARRTRFTVGIVGNLLPVGTIMIPTDQISIEVTANNQPIGLAPAGDGSLVPETLGTTFNFSDFSGAFGIRYDDAANDMTVLKMEDITQGERWALAI